MNHEFIDALEQVEKEKGISKEILLDAIETALASAYKRDQKAAQSIEVRIDSNTGALHVYTHKTVVEEVEDEKNEISLEEAQKINPIYELNDLVEFEIFPKEFGRIAAQTAKQVVVQRIREAERSIIYDEFVNRVGDLITGIIQRIEQRTIYIDLGRIEGVLPVNEQMPNEQYEPNMRLKTYIVEVKKTTKGPQIILSRARTGLIKRLFELEVPEIQDGIVEIKSVSREPGYRSKVAVYSRDPQIDPVGACVGSRGIRVQMIVRELKGEKIDIVPWSNDPIEFIVNALSPAKVSEVKILPSKKMAIVIVPDFQLSLAIGKEGQNARLAAKLTGWKIDIKSESQAEECRPEIEQLVREEIGFSDSVLDDVEPELKWINQEETADILVDEEVITEIENNQTTVPNGVEPEIVDFETKVDDFVEDLEEEEEEVHFKKKTKKAKTTQKQRAKIELDDELSGEDESYFFTDVLEKTNSGEQQTNLDGEVFTTQPEEQGFTIGQLLGEELLKKANKDAKKEKKKGDK
ncbi:MAG TPA: transcription termination factor NusA [Bacillota bacterium]|jgi:N utilization substance protein A|nr:transcription termination factor NusA [Bacillota bacterium]HOL09371.1 transcription termination factor NusA [Bacillota bacterium]HPO97080.1 transcription termination factor NusA [Bacillota bacterium]